MNTPEIAIACVSNVYVRMMSFKNAGDIEVQHTHPFDHLTLLSSGSVRVTVDGQSRDFVAPQGIFVKANAVHELVALVDNTVVSCIHALREGEHIEDIIPPDAFISDTDRVRLIEKLRVKS